MHTLSLLLIDDERMEREGIAYLCRKLPVTFSVSEAKNGQEALTLMAQHHFDVVIVDIRMPVMGGLEFLEAATRCFPRAKYIIYSAYGDFAYAKEAINLKVEDYLLKPIEEEEFFALMNKVITRLTQDRREAQQNAIYRAIRGLNAPQKEAMEALGEDSGVALLLYLEKPVLDSMSKILIELTQARFSQAHVFIGNEQECYVVLLGDIDSLRERVECMVGEINNQLQTGCQVMITTVFNGYDQLKNSIQEGMRLMSRGFFTKDNAVVSVDELKDSRDAFDFFEQEESAVLQKVGTSEIINYIMKGYEGIEKYRNIYTKYTLVKQIERYVQYVSPEMIERMLSSRSLSEFRMAVEQIVVENPREISIIEAAKAYIHEHYNEDLSIDNVADYVFLNSNYLCTVFKKETGKTLIAYLTEYRMSKAIDLITNTLMKVSDVAKQVGYRNPSYFNMIFKNHFGNTPTAYRKGES